MEALQGILERKTATIMSLESEKEILSAELVSTRELSKIHQHLQVCIRSFFIIEKNLTVGGKGLSHMEFL